MYNVPGAMTSSGTHIFSRMQGRAAIMRTLCLFAVCLMTPAFQATAWGPEGHVVIAMVAEGRLTPKARATARKILSGAPLVTAALFADEYRVTHPETSRWHYVDIPFEATGYDDARDCAVQTAGDCVIRAIERAKALVKDPQTPIYDRADALKYLVHFVGDLHQPFHAIERKLPDGKGDRGGNDVRVKFFGAETNLHSVWDSGLILRTGRTAEDYARHLNDNFLATMSENEWRNGTLVDWALESHGAAKGAYVPVATPPVALDQAYFDTQIMVVDRRLALASARLAWILEDLLN
jgi:hypothetical protein